MQYELPFNVNAVTVMRLLSVETSHETERELYR